MKTPTAARDILYIVAIQIWEYFSFYGMRAFTSFSISPISLVLMITMPSACSAHMLSGLRYPYSRRLACRPPARQPHCSDCRRAVNDPLAMWCWALIQIQPLACIWRWQSLFVATVYSNQTSAVCLASSTTRTIIDMMAVFRCCMLRAISVPSQPPSPAAWLLSGMDGMLALPPRGGMFIGLLIFLSGHRHFQSTRSMDKKALTSVKFALPVWSWLVVMLCLAPVFLPC